MAKFNSFLPIIVLCGFMGSVQAYASNPMSLMLPVLTAELTPGKVTTSSAPTHIGMPLFIVGDDELSHRWLNARKVYLKSIHAVGIVVNVKSEAGLARMNSYGLTMYPVPGKDFARAFGLTHYPVLIENQKIKQ
ncbi:integrating conjugative element protein [Vibrio sinensis]|uniref:Integrating conjugative element protein n=1 Tax=Vibrio sinensis TaxID=2302434 RepID=A0A3A6QF03_9VIBR|nr:integrating conjugative element protein [Vibrio sinensis]RJX68662.1 integrating conjugative element protein [Vibrio sinensis]